MTVKLLLPASIAMFLTACSSDGYLGHPDGYHQDGGSTYEDQQTDADVADDVQWPETTWTWSGAFVLDDTTASTDENGNVFGSWTGHEETEVAVGGSVACGLRWSMRENLEPSSDEPCSSCEKAWDVTCDSGHVAVGDQCGDYFTADYYETPQTFGIGFVATGEADADGVAPGMVMFNDPLDPGWYAGGDATFDGSVLSYSLSYVE